MAHQVILNSKVWFGGFDLSGDLSAVSFRSGADLKDGTTLGMASRARFGGLKDVQAQHEGFWNGGTNQIDEILYNKVAVTDVPMSVAPSTGAEGERAYTFLAGVGEYHPGAQVGEMFAFSVSAQSSGSALIGGTVIHNATKTATGNGTAFQLGQGPAGQRLYAALHVIAASGSTPSLIVKVQSDTVGFPSPTDQITFNAATTIGYQWASAAGAITDDYWRVSYTISGSSPSFTFVVVAGIL